MDDADQQPDSGIKKSIQVEDPIDEREEIKFDSEVRKKEEEVQRKKSSVF